MNHHFIERSVSRHRFSRAKLVNITCVFAASMFVAGCGPPVLSQMRPTVSKTSIWIGVVDKPSTWSTSVLEQSFLSAGIIPQVEDLTASNASTALSHALSALPANLYVLALDGPVSNQVLSVMAAHPKSRYEVVLPEPVAIPGARVYANSGAASGYVLGYLAGLAASDHLDTSVGIVADGPVTATKAQIQGALLGVYASNSQLQLQAVNWAAGTGTGTGTVPPAAGLPHVIIATRPLSAAQWQIIRQAGSVVVSLVSSSGQNSLVIGQPELPSPDGFVADAKSISGGQWKPGVSLDSMAPNVQIESAALSAASFSALQSILQGSSPTSLHLTQAWHVLPAPLRTSWMQWVNLGTAAESLS